MQFAAGFYARMFQPSTDSFARERDVRIREKLVRELGPEICAFLADPSVVEIMLNADGALWVERVGRGVARFGSMGASQAEALMATIAAAKRTTIAHDNPILECELPLDGSRFEGLLPPVVPAPVFAIRRRPGTIFTLADYVAADIMTGRQREIVATAIEGRRNILIVGGTGTGKTTLVNAVIDHLSKACPADRLLILEDTAEIQCASANAVTLRTSESVDLRRLLRATMRLRPDRILVGEVRGAEALDLLKAWNTGHPGGVATLHANDAASALTRLENLVAEATSAPMQSTIAAAIDLVVSIARVGTGRRVQELVRVTGFDGENYLTTKED